MKKFNTSNEREIKKRWMQENLGYKTGMTWSWMIGVREQAHSRVTSNFLTWLTGRMAVLTIGERTCN